MAAAVAISPTEAFVSQPVSVVCTGFAVSGTVTVRCDELDITMSGAADLSGNVTLDGFSFPREGNYHIKSSDGTSTVNSRVRVWSR